MDAFLKDSFLIEMLFHCLFIAMWIKKKVLVIWKVWSALMPSQKHVQGHEATYHNIINVYLAKPVFENVGGPFMIVHAALQGQGFAYGGTLM